jgi:hypothetical protein
MSVSVSLYRIPEWAFEELRASGPVPELTGEAAKSDATFEKSFCGLEFVLAKGESEATAKLLAEIFNPRQCLGSFDSDPERFAEAFDEGRLPIQFLDPSFIREAHAALERITEADIRSRFDADELNREEIYPEVWQSNDSPEFGYNPRHLVAEFAQLKAIIGDAAREKDFILVFGG